MSGLPLKVTAALRSSVEQLKNKFNTTKTTINFHIKPSYEDDYLRITEKEKYYQTIFYVVLKLINLKSDVEKATNIGRIDMVVEVKEAIYIFEFKLNKSAEEALKQIYDNKYYEEYLGSNKKIILIGINFSSKERSVADYLFKEFDRTELV